MDLETSRTQAPTNEIIDEFLVQLPDTQHRVLLIKVKSNNIETHDGARCFKQCIIGRGSDSDFVVNDKACSRKHCIIFFRQDRLCIRDLYTRSGTFVNGVRIPVFEDFYLLEKDIVQINEDSIIVQQVDNIKVILPSEIKTVDEMAVTITAAECPYCSKQQNLLIDNVQSVKTHLKQLIEKIKAQKQQQAQINISVETSLTQIKELEKQQKIAFIEPKTPSFKTKVKENPKPVQPKNDDALKMEDIASEPVVAEKKSFFGMFKSKSVAQNIDEPVQEPVGEKPEQIPQESKSKGWFGKSKKVTIKKPEEKKIPLEKPRKSFGIFSKPATPKTDAAENLEEQPAPKKSVFGLVSKLFSKKSQQNDLEAVDLVLNENPQYVFDNDDKIE